MPKLPLSKLIDIPPVWLVLFILLARLQADRLPVWTFQHPVMDLVGGLLVGGGVLLMLMAVVQMQQNKTTVIPHMTPDALVTNGVFARSRNPIYLGDVMVLAGLILFWGNWVALVLVPLFLWVITDRFILPEEERMRDQFESGFAQYCAQTRRWL